ERNTRAEVEIHALGRQVGRRRRAAPRSPDGDGSDSGERTGGDLPTRCVLTSRRQARPREGSTRRPYRADDASGLSRDTAAAGGVPLPERAATPALASVRRPERRRWFRLRIACDL